MDGIDAAIVQTDGCKVVATGPAVTLAYDDSLRNAIRDATGKTNVKAPLIDELTDAHISVVNEIFAQHPEYREKVKVIGLHGHTMLHAPQDRITLQIGDGETLARAVGIDVVYDFRSADVARGGQGAPLAPLYHCAIFRDFNRPIAVINIGGISNITWIGDEDGTSPIAFDTGPGNALLDDWVQDKTGDLLDRDGQISASGLADDTIVEKLMRHPYFDRSPPKSLDRHDFSLLPFQSLSPRDGAATLVRFTCRSILSGLDHVPQPPKRLLITGGGRRNPTIMGNLSHISAVPVDPVETVGWNGDSMEAQAFAFLAVRSLRGLPLSIPSTTGVPSPTKGGILSKAR